MKNKVVFITGSSKGIGKTLAIECAKIGAKVVINGRSQNSLENAFEALNSVSTGHLALAGDVSDSARCDEMISEIIAYYGKLDVLVNNAGIAARGLFSEMSSPSWKQVLELNTMGCIFPTVSAMPELIKTKGSVIFISSIGGRAGLPGHGAYSASKMPLASLAETIGVEYEKQGVHSGLVYVGFTENEPDKQIMSGDGKYQTIASRPAYLLQSREKVARSIIKVITRRKRKTVLSAVGKMQSIVFMCGPMRRMILRKALKSYMGMYD